MGSGGVKNVDISGVDQQVVAVRFSRYFGFSVRETSGAAAAMLRIHEGTNATGDILDVIDLKAGESAREWYGPQGIDADGGIFVDVVSGAVEGSVRAVGGLV